MKERIPKLINVRFQGLDMEYTSVDNKIPSYLDK